MCFHAPASCSMKGPRSRSTPPFFTACGGFTPWRRHAAAREVSQQCLALAERHRHDEAAALGHYILGDTLWATGAFAEARSHLEHILKLYEPLYESGAAQRFQHNYDVNALAFLAWSLWPLGYPKAGGARRDPNYRPRAAGRACSAAGVCLALRRSSRRGLRDDDEPGTGIADEAVAFCVQHGVAAYEPWARFWARRGFCPAR